VFDYLKNMSLKNLGLSLTVGIGLMSSSAAWSEELQIGAIFPLSGPNAIYGDIFTSAFKLAERHVKEDGLLDGDFSILYEDSQALPQQAVTAMNKMVNVQGLQYVLTAFTGQTKAISPIAKRSQTVIINGGAVGPDLAKLTDYLWNVIPLANTELHGLLPYIVKERGLKSFVLLYVDDPLGDGILDVLNSDLPPLGATLDKTFSVAPTTQQFSGIAASIRNIGPDVVFVASYGDQMIQIVKQLRENGVKAQLASYSAFSTPNLQTLPAAKGALYARQAVNIDSDDNLTTRYLKDYQEEYGKSPSVYATNYYNAVWLYVLLAHELQKQGKEVTGENLLAQRRAMDSFPLVGGTVTFDDTGVLLAPIQVMEIDGEAGKTLSVMSTNN